MLGKLVAYVAVGIATLMVAGPAAADSHYAPKVSTSCNVDVSARAGKPVSAYIDVKGNASDSIHGTVTISVYRADRGGHAKAASASSGARVWSTSTHYAGKPLRVHGPVLDRGSYRAVADFSADPGVYLDCQCFGRVTTAAHSGPGRGDPTGLSGLPNTGGPSQWWLLLGGALVLAGGGAVYAGRRRAHA